MKAVRTEVFAAWMRKLKDDRAVAKILARIDRLLLLGNPGDVKSAGGGVSELRVDYGPGYRVYFAERRNVVIVLLCGGTKKTQREDIKDAKRLLANWNEME